MRSRAEVSQVINQLISDRAEIREIEILGQGRFLNCRNAGDIVCFCVFQVALFSCFDMQCGSAIEKNSSGPICFGTTAVAGLATVRLNQG